MTLPPSPFTREHFLALGHPRRDLDRLLEAGEVMRLRHGWYAQPTHGAPRPGWEGQVDQHLARLASVLASRPGHAASHTTAALLHQLAVTIAPETPVHLTTVDPVAVSRRYPGLTIHRSESVTNETEMIDGVRATTLVRTVVDVLRTRTLPHGLALLDDALRRGVVDLDELRVLIDQQKRWGGRPKALAAIHLADPARETWGESFSFAHLHLQGQPMPMPQVEIYDAQRRLLGRDDPGAVSRRVNRAAAGVDPTAFTGWVRWDDKVRKLPFTVERPSVHPETLRYRRSPRRRAA